MDKQQFRIDKNEKLLTLLQKRKGSIATVVNEGDTIIQEDKTIMGKPVITDAVPRDGQTLVYNKRKKRWEAGRNLTITYVSATANRRTDLTTEDAGLYAHWDAETADLVVWTGITWSDQDAP